MQKCKFRIKLYRQLQNWVKMGQKKCNLLNFNVLDSISITSRSAIFSILGCLKFECIYILDNNVYMIFHLQFIVAHVLPFCVRCVHKINGMREYNMYMGLLLPKVFQITHWKWAQLRLSLKPLLLLLVLCCCC